MGKLAVYKYVAAMFLVIQIIVCLFTFLGLFGGDVNPIGNSSRAMIVYILPLMIIANFLLLFYWLIRRRWFYALIPVITIACCVPYIGTLLQFRSLNREPTPRKDSRLPPTTLLCSDERLRDSRLLTYWLKYVDRRLTYSASRNTTTSAATRRTRQHTRSTSHTCRLDAKTW